MPFQQRRYVTLAAACALQLAGAHYAMSEPSWNAGGADTSECDEVIKSTFGYETFLNNKQLKDRPNCISIKEGDPLPIAGKFFFFNHTSHDVTVEHTIISPADLNLPAKTDGTLCVNTTGGNYNKLMQCLWKLDRQSFWFNTGSQIGCPAVTGQVCDTSAPCCDKKLLVQPTNNDPNLLSFNHNNQDESYKFNPWRSPGVAPVLDACGIVGGFTFAEGHPELYFGGPTVEGGETASKTGIINAAQAPEGLQYKAGTKGSPLVYDFLHGGDTYTTNVTKWTAGGTATVAQGALYANHGGGYQYRLCKKSEFTRDGASNEDCFQQLPLDYASDQSWIRTSNGTEIPFPAVRVTDANTEGVKPKGSTWTKMPIPTTTCKTAPCFKHPGNNVQFAPPVPANSSLVEAFGLGGADYGLAESDLNKGITEKTYDSVKKHYDFEVVDRVKVPKVEPGMYVMSWRWDSEQTPQVWSNCAVVEIEEGGEDSAKAKAKAQTKKSLRGAAQAMEKSTVGNR